ncbi:MAG: sulfatase-like hydrolase/transferase [Acidobacteriota bacterium]|jgi:arylsulfatase A-like enzyme
MILLTASRRLARRPLVLAATLAMLLFAGGCGSPPSVETYIAELVPFGSGGVATDLIFPRESGASRFLVRNWPPMRSVTGDSMWVFGSWADVGFYTVADEPPTFVFEARPFSHPEAPTQLLTLLLNGSQIEALAMPRRWETYEIELPTDLLEVGWNEIELRFSESYRPSDYDPDNNDRRTLTAQFRRLEMRGAAGRPYWAERPEAVTLQGSSGPPVTPAVATGAPSATGDSAATDARDTAPTAGEPISAGADAAALFTGDPADIAIEMPVDSYFQAYLVPSDDGGVVGALSAEFEPAATGVIHAEVDIVEPDAATAVWSAELTPQSSEGQVSADLSPWAGEVVALRLRVFGDANGVVRWRGLGVTGSTPPEDSLAPATFARPPASGALGHPDIFLIIIDAARADRFLGDIGAELAPNIQALAADGTQFTHVWAPSSWTGQSIPALWSGITPDTAGIEHWGSRLPPQVTTFPELVLDAGYHTMLFSQHNIYRARPMLRNGFEVFREVESSDITQRVIVPSIAEVIDDERPTLGVFHLLPPHDPYLPPEPFLGSRSSWYHGEPIDARLLNQFDDRFPSEDVELRDEVRRAAIAMYEENIEFADSLVGRLVKGLRDEGRYEDALVIVLADHGEAFYEHERFLHTSQVYEEFVRIPLVIKWPRSLTGFVPQVDAPVSLLDVTATIIDGLGIDDERADYQGRSLLGLARGEPAPRRMLYTYTSGETDPEKDPKPKYALLWNDLKLLYDGRRDTAALYRLSDDPGEHTDISLQESFYSAWLLQTLRLARAHNSGYLLQIGGARAEDLDEETVRRLRALGYLR